MSNDVRLSAEQLDELVNEGAITAEQRDALLAKREPGGHGLSLSTVALYFGGFLVFLTYMSASGGILFASAIGALAWGLLTMVLSGAAGTYLWQQTRHKLAGQMLIVVAGSMVPYMVFSLFAMGGLLEGGGGYHQFINEVQPSFLTASLVTAAILVVALLRVRAPLLTVVLASVVVLVILDLAAWVGVQAGSSGYVEGSMTMLLAAPFGLVSLWLERRAKENYAFWLALGALATACAGLEMIVVAAAVDMDSTVVPIATGLVSAALWLGVGVYTQKMTTRGTENVFYVVGSLLVVVGVAVPCFLEGGHAVNVVYLLANTAVVVLGVEMQRRVPIAAGALGAYIYLFAEAGTVFGDNTRWFMTLIGLLIIGAALGYEQLRDTPATERQSQ